MGRRAQRASITDSSWLSERRERQRTQRVPRRAPNPARFSAPKIASPNQPPAAQRAVLAFTQGETANATVKVKVKVTVKVTVTA